MQVEPFTISVLDADLKDLRRRLELSRWPSYKARPDWQDGSDAEYLKKVVEYWIDGFDWRRHEARLNMMSQSMARLGSADIHFIQQRGEGPSPMPIILTHGWPGSFLEMERIIPLLANPARNGGSPLDAFDVVVPSLPGFGFSEQPLKPGIGAFEVAGLWCELMRGLGYERFAVQGGDIGASVSTWLGRRYPSEVTGVHLNYLPGSYRPDLGDGQPPISGEEKEFLDKCAEWADLEGGYMHVQGTKPQTLAFGLNDSPVGLLAWMIEKFRAWSDCGGELERAISLDSILTNVCIYWFTNTIASSVQMYKENRARPVHFSLGERIISPTAFSVFPGEISHPPRSWVERAYNVHRWTVMPRGGHFAALEAPELLADDIRAFFRPIRAAYVG